MAVMRPENACSGKASTVARTVWPIRTRPAWTPGIVSCRRSGSILSSVTTERRGLNVLAERDPALADEPGERRDDRHVGDSLFGERKLGVCLCDRGARGVDVLHGGLGARACLIGHGDRDVAGSEKRRVALGRRLRQCVLRFGELEVGLRAADRRPCFVEPQPGVDALQADEHRAFLDELAHVDRRGDHAAGGIRGNVGRFVGLEAAGGFEGDGLLLRRDGRHRDGNRGRRRRRRLGRRATAASGDCPGSADSPDSRATATKRAATRSEEPGLRRITSAPHRTVPARGPRTRVTRFGGPPARTTRPFRSRRRF